jgi:hypothetical protein
MFKVLQDNIQDGVQAYIQDSAQTIVQDGT